MSMASHTCDECDLNGHIVCSICGKVTDYIDYSPVQFSDADNQGDLLINKRYHPCTRFKTKLTSDGLYDTMEVEVLYREMLRLYSNFVDTTARKNFYRFEFTVCFICSKVGLPMYKKYLRRSFYKIQSTHQRSLARMEELWNA